MTTIQWIQAARALAILYNTLQANTPPVGELTETEKAEVAAANDEVNSAVARWDAAKSKQ